MPQQHTGVLLLIGKGDRIFSALRMLVQDAGGQVFSEHLVTSDSTLLPLPERLRLDPAQLELIQEPEAGRPAIYRHRGLLAVP
jgi:hypothetical protein